MGRPLRVNVGGLVYHVLNRANSRLRIFFDDGDYAAFEKVMTEAIQRYSMRVIDYVLMPNHWHMVLWPRRDGDLSKFVGWLTLTHTQRWHAHRHNAGVGHLYQGRFKSFPVQDDRHLKIVCRYVVRNPLRANLVNAAQNWQWSSLWRSAHDAAAEPKEVDLLPPVTDGPLERGQDWLQYVNATASAAEEQAFLTSMARGCPFGSAAWQQRTATRLGLESTLRPRGRPRTQKPTQNVRKGS